MSAAKRGRVVSVETRGKISAAQKGKDVSVETRAKMSAAKRGKASHNAKLTDSQVRDIRRRLSVGEKQAVIAREYGVTPTTVYDIKTGRAYSSVGDETPWSGTRLLC